jgi:tryptophan synthase alpha chain
MKGVERIAHAFQTATKPLCTAFITVGFPKYDSTPDITVALVEAGVGMIELGVPFSDSLVDGEVIQHANSVALAGGMTLEGYFAEVAKVRAKSSVPLILMGALNPLLAYGFERALDRCCEVGIDGLILPELPPEEFAEHWCDAFSKRGLGYIPLITTRTPIDRVHWLDAIACGFLYLVSGVGTTGGGFNQDETARNELKEILSLTLSNPVQVGFGIRSAKDFQDATSKAQGGVVGSALLRAIEGAGCPTSGARDFIWQILNDPSMR